ncbi:MAG: hypothetical protein IJ711_04055 [Lachnospiraceae bacterium]|nr:hypothetical protein [Lachnospiraceae bacterium]
MNRLIACVGAYAKKPYRIRHIKTDIYCIEELCYYLCEYTSLLDRELMNDELITWLEEQCRLRELADTLRGICRRKEPLAVYVGTILKATGYAQPERLKAIQETLRQEETLSRFERKKKRADHLIQERKLYDGIDIYHQLLREIPESDSRLLSQVLYNCGVAYAKLFYFDIAQELFERALGLCDDAEIKAAYLYCRRCGLTKQEYVDFTADHPEFYEDSLALERTLSNLRNEWEQSAERKELEELLTGRGDSGFPASEQKLEEKLGEWEKEYSAMVRRN